MTHAGDALVVLRGIPYVYHHNVECALQMRGDIYPDGTLIPTSRDIGVKFDQGCISVYEFDRFSRVPVAHKIFSTAPGELVPDVDEAVEARARKARELQDKIDDIGEEIWDLKRQSDRLENELAELLKEGMAR